MTLMESEPHPRLVELRNHLQSLLSCDRKQAAVACNRVSDHAHVEELLACDDAKVAESILARSVTAVVTPVEEEPKPTRRRSRRKNTEE